MQLVILVVGYKTKWSRKEGYVSKAVADSMARGESPLLLSAVASQFGQAVGLRERVDTMLWWVEAAVKVVVYDDLPEIPDTDQRIIDEAYEAGMTVERRKIPDWGVPDPREAVLLPKDMDTLVYLNTDNASEVDRAFKFLSRCGVHAETSMSTVAATAEPSLRLKFPATDQDQWYVLLASYSWYVWHDDRINKWFVAEQGVFEKTHGDSYRYGSYQTILSGTPNPGWSVPPPSPLIWI